MRTITICGIKHDIEYNAIAYINYKKFFGIGIFEDLRIIETFLRSQVLIANEIISKNPKIKDKDFVKQLSRTMIDDVDSFIEAVIRITYFGELTANSKIGSYEDWVKQIERINVNDDWIVEVAEYAVSCFC